MESSSIFEGLFLFHYQSLKFLELKNTHLQHFTLNSIFAGNPSTGFAVMDINTVKADTREGFHQTFSSNGA
jgi:hypothetical protein